MSNHDNKEKRSKATASGQAPVTQRLSIQQALDLALQEHGAGRFSEAEGLYQQVLQADPNQPVALHLLGVIAHQNGNNDVAEELITKAVALKPDYAEAQNNLGIVLRERGRPEDAVACCRKAIVLQPFNSAAHNNLGNALHEMGRLDEAVTSYHKALFIYPDFAEAHNNLGNVLQELGHVDDAAASYEKYLAIEQDPEGYLNLGSSYQELGRLDEAVASYHKALAIYPDFAEVHNNLGNALKELGRFQDAVASCRKAIALKPGFAEAHYNLGTALQKLGELESAVDSYQTAATGSARAKALECLYALERHEELYETLEKFAAEDKSNLRVAAISVFASHQLGLDNPHPFCKNPLDFIRVGTIADSAEEIDALAGEVLEDLKNIHAVWEPPRVTTISGYQTPGNLFASPEGYLAKLDSIIKTEINAYHFEFKSESCVFIDLWPQELRLRGWLVRLLKGGHQNDHIHPGGWLSGVIYLKLPEQLNGDEGCIEFNLGGYVFPHLIDDWPTKLHRPKVGEIVLFPSSLFHRTIPTATDDERISLSFDLFPASTG